MADDDDVPTFRPGEKRHRTRKYRPWVSDSYITDPPGDCPYARNYCPCPHKHVNVTIVEYTMCSYFCKTGKKGLCQKKKEKDKERKEEIRRINNIINHERRPEC